MRNALIGMAVSGLVCAVDSQQVMAQGTFRTQSLGILEGFPRPYDPRYFRINNQSVVVGQVGQNFFAKAATWQNGIVTQLPVWPNGNYALGIGINDSGTVAVEADDSFNNKFGAIYRNGGYTSLLYPANSNVNYLTPRSINNSGQLVGYATSLGFYGYPGRAFYHAGPNGNTRPVILGIPSGYVASVAHEISDSGLIVGNISTSINASQAAVWRSSDLNSIIYLTSLDSSFVSSNSNNKAVGYVGSTAVEFTFPVSGSITSRSLGSGIANGININDMSVGNSVRTNDPTLSTGFVVYGDTRYNLNLLQSSPNGRILYTADDVNSRGEIVGLSNQGGYIAIPELARLASGTWTESSKWSWGQVPNPRSPVRIESATVDGPLTATTIAELHVGESGTAAKLTLKGNPLTVSNTNLSYATGKVNVGLQGTLAGVGTLASSDVQVNGTIAPGTSAGTITIDGNLTLSHTATVVMEIMGNANGSFDTLQITQSAVLAGTMIFDFSQFSGSFDQTLNIISAGSISGDFDQYSFIGIDPNSVQIELTSSQLSISPVAVPEMASVLLLLAGLGGGAGFAWLKWRNNTRQWESTFDSNV